MKGDALGFDNIDASEWPLVKCGDRQHSFQHGYEYITTSQGIHLTLVGLGMLAWLSDDIDLKQMYFNRRQKMKARALSADLHTLTLNITDTDVRRLRELHERGEGTW